MASLLPPNYGYVFGVLGSSFIMNTYLTINVAMARKKYKVKPLSFLLIYDHFVTNLHCQML